jgi:protein O-GlcNAc transferase
MASGIPRAADQLADARRQASLHPGRAEPQQQLGMLLASLVGLQPAVAPLTRATWLSPAHIDGYINLGIVLIELQRFDHAIAALRRALALLPAEADIHHGIGVGAAAFGRSHEAERSLRRALRLQPAGAETMVRLANVLIALRRPDEAASLERRALSLLPSRGPAHFDLGVALARIERHRPAVVFSLRALALEPRSTQPLVNAAASLVLLGETKRAVAYLKRAAFADGAGPDPFRNLMAVMSYDPQVTVEEHWAVARDFDARHGRRPSTVRFAQRRDPGKRLVVGYLSSDLYEHAVARNLAPIIEGHDPAQVEAIAYSTSGTFDRRSARLRETTGRWRSVEALADAALADLVRADAVDILVSVAGRFDRNRPQLATYRAAPVQMSLYDGGTSGLAEMDYLIADRMLVPPPALRRERFTERVLRLPSLYVHDRLANPSPVSPLPTLRRGYLTFGCFGNPAKISDATLRLWTDVLGALPRSRLRLKYQSRYDDPDVRRRILDGLAGASDRVDFVAAESSLDEHLRQYAKIDIALDTFPFTGSTTTWEALWMGVPVMTLIGDTLVSRLSASFLKPIGLDDFIATSPQAYGTTVRRLAGDLEGLNALRQSLRRRVAESPLCDGRARARQFERLYRSVWRRWCDRAQ